MSNFTATATVTTSRLRFDLVIQSGGAASGLKAIELWGQGEHVNVKDAAALLAALGGTNPPAHACLYPVIPAQGVIGGTNDDSTYNRSTFTLDRDPNDLKRAYLAYEVLGLSHWAAAIRAVSDRVSLGVASPCRRQTPGRRRSSRSIPPHFTAARTRSAFRCRAVRPTPIRCVTCA